MLIAFYEKEAAVKPPNEQALKVMLEAYLKPARYKKQGNGPKNWLWALTAHCTKMWESIVKVLDSEWGITSGETVDWPMQEVERIRKLL